MASKTTPKLTPKMIKKISSFGTENRIIIHLKSYTNSTPKSGSKMDSKSGSKSHPKSDTKSGPKNTRFYTPFDYDFIFLTFICSNEFLITCLYPTSTTLQKGDKASAKIPIIMFVNLSILLGL